MIHYNISIIFERIPNQMVVGYEILKNLISPEGQIRQKRIAFIPDTGPSPLLTEKELMLDDSYANHKLMGNLLFKIPNANLIIDPAHPFELYADGILLPDDTYLLHADKACLIYYSVSESLPVLKAKYYIDAIKYEIDAADSLSYTIIPNINETLSVIGRHTELV